VAPHGLVWPTGGSVDRRLDRAFQGSDYERLPAMAQRVDRKPAPGSSHDRPQRGRQVRVTAASTRRLRFTQVVLGLVLLVVAFSGGRAWEGLAGLLAQSLGFVLVVWATLWRMWSSLFIAGRKDLEIVDQGPYARCRHPLYLGSVVAAIGIGLTTRSVLVTVALPATIGAALLLAIRLEEATLAACHGDRWRHYCRRVPPLLPRLGALALPARREVDLPVFGKAFLDAASVLGLWLLVLLLDALRIQLGWPVYLQMP
jgi:protein-S-isoprenylcysteine O-methyltransferase Ste14